MGPTFLIPVGRLIRVPGLVRALGLGLVLLGHAIAPAAALADDPLPSPPPPRPEPERVFVGYLYNTALDDVSFAPYTHVCHAFVTAGPEGRLNPGPSIPGARVVAAAHEAGVEVLLSLGGWGWDDQFAAIARDPEAEDRYVQAVLDLVRDTGYDGLDLDWEYPDTREEVAGFERLSRRLRDGLDALGRERQKHLWLTMAASSNPGTLRWLETPFLVQTFDWINVMTYDMAGDWTGYAGHNAPLRPSSRVPGGPARAPSAQATIRFLLDERQLPPERIALGIPLYGRGFPVKEPYASTRDPNAKTENPTRRLPAGTYRNLQRLHQDDGWQRVWDPETQVPWLIAPDASAVFGYDDPESAALKGQWARQHNLRGVFFWEIGQDRLPDGSNPVQQAARDGLFAAPSR